MPLRKDMALAASDGLTTTSGHHVRGPTEQNEIIVERRDGSTEVISRANAYAGMVAHFDAVGAGDEKPTFGRHESLRLARILDELHCQTTPECTLSA